MSAEAVVNLLERRHDPAFLRLVALAWLVRRGLRQTACCCSDGVRDVTAAIGAHVEFSVRPEEARRADRYDLGDGVVMYAAGTRPTLEPAWNGHRRNYDRQRDLGIALGYLTPQAERSQGERKLYHLASFAGTQTEIWVEWVLPGAERANIDEYTRRIGGALAEIGVGHATREKRIESAGVS